MNSTFLSMTHRTVDSNRPHKHNSQFPEVLHILYNSLHKEGMIY